MKSHLQIGMLSVLALSSLAAQDWDTSGNGLLSGTYKFRQVAYRVSGTTENAVALYGSITFDGNGNYSIDGTVVGYVSPAIQPVSAIGRYSISASGYGFLSSALSDGDSVYGLVSNGVFVGSSTENGSYSDIFVAVASGGSTASSFQGQYMAGYINLLASSRFDALVQMTPDGKGSLGTVNTAAYQSGNANPVNASQAGITYAINGGVVSAAFPAQAPLKVSGQQLWYVSPDGSFLVGGSATGWDLLLGVRSGAAAGTPFAGLYYQAGINEEAPGGSRSFESYYGSMATNAGILVGHKRSQSGRTGQTLDITYTDTYPQQLTGQYTNTVTATRYMLGSSGSVRIGIGGGQRVEVSVAISAPTFSGSDVYLNPVGIQNSASSAPFTASIAPGELILLNGSGLADSTVVNSTSPFPPTLGGVQVLVNEIASPIFYVTSNLIAAIVPYGLNSPVASIRVTNNGKSSNFIVAFVGSVAPGVFTNPPGGAGYAIAQHVPDYSLVTPTNPALPGELILCYLTGTGAVSPAVADGDPGPILPLSNTVDSIGVKVGGVSANILYSGLAPTLSGLYAVVFTVPDGVTSGDALLEVSGSQATSAESLLSIAAAH